MSLVAWYPLVSNLKDQGLLNNDLTYRTSSTITFTAGKLGNAATFSGNSATLQRPILKLTEHFTASCWFLISEATSTWQAIFSNGRDVASDGFGLFISSNLELSWQCGSVRQTTSTIDTNKWYHFAIVCDGNKAYMYLNGSLESTQTIATQPIYAQGGDSLNIGMTANGNVYNYPLKGQVQDLRIYDNSLSKREIKELSKGLCTHLSLDWGGNPNMIGGSYTWMEKDLGSAHSYSSHSNRKVYWDDSAPSPWVYTDTLTSNSDVSRVSGDFYGYVAQGVELTDLVENEIYTYSFWAKSVSGIEGGFQPSSICESQTLISTSGFGTLNNTWRKHIVTFKWTRTNKLTCCFYVTVPVNATIDFELCNIKLEKGSQATPYIPRSDESIYTSFNYGNKAFEDVSGYSNNATPTHCDNYYPSPRGLSATDFIAKTSHIVLPIVLSSATAITISIWAKLDSDSLTTSSNGTSNIVALGTNDFTRFRIQDNGTKGYYNIGNSALSTTFDVSNIVGGSWHHYALTWQGGVGAKFYIDGVLKNTTNNTSLTSIVSTQPWKLGEYTGGVETMDGQLADFRLYSTALSADDIKSLYQTSAEICKNGTFMTIQLVEE